MPTAVERRLNRLRRKKGLRKSQPLSFEAGKESTFTENVTIPDINHGAWSFIDQPTAPDYPGEKFAFLD